MFVLTNAQAHLSTLPRTLGSVPNEEGERGVRLWNLVHAMEDQLRVAHKTAPHVRDHT